MVGIVTKLANGKSITARHSYLVCSQTLIISPQTTGHPGMKTDKQLLKVTRWNLFLVCCQPTLANQIPDPHYVVNRESSADTSIHTNFSLLGKREFGTLNQVVKGVLGTGYAFDAVAVGPYAHRFRRFWTNLIPTTLLNMQLSSCSALVSVDLFFL
jgi:hypothetical protein